MKWFFPIVLAGTMLFISCQPQPQSVRYTPNFILSDQPPFEIAEDQVYSFGYLEVPENRSMRESRMIRLPVYIFKSRNPTPATDPIIYTVGGPGGSTMSSAQYMKYYRYLDDRDFILFEQRGTRHAIPRLDCPEWATAIGQTSRPGYDVALRDSLLVQAASQCRDRHVQNGVDLNGYNTKESAADIADLAKVLDLPAYNLLTISYSTKIAQVLLRDHPEGIRSVVMDSPLPLEVSYDEESVGNLLEKVHQLFDACEADPACKQAFPNLQDRFFNYLKQLSKTPLTITMENPKTGKEEKYTINGKEILSLYASTPASDLGGFPLAVDQLLKNELEQLVAGLGTLFDQPKASGGQAVRISVWCAEEYPFASQEVIKAETNKYPETGGLSPTVFKSNICETWKVKAASPVENQAISSEVPVLLISGEYDHDTPPKWAAAMQKNLPNSYHLVFKGWKHTPTTNWSDPCGMQTAQAFFNDPSKAPKLDCLQEITGVQFLYSAH